VDLAALAAAYGVAHRRVGTTAELAEALTGPVEGRSIIEVSTDRHQLGELHRAIRAAVATAVEGLPQT
jgi:2-succinyl-5-enolpyruvyl-6-hydroxy-3-cyclohexene-1-carboxylate synthase